MTRTIIPSANSVVTRRAIDQVLNGLSSVNTMRAYERALDDFLTWLQAQDAPFIKETVQKYRMHLVKEGRSAAAINQRLSAIKRLAQEAEDNLLLPTQVANGIMRVKGIRIKGRKVGLWLQKEEAEKLLGLPDRDVLSGIRDAALLGTLIGSGLRRAECADLRVENISHREGRPVLVDILGKGNKYRTIPIHEWTFGYLEKWLYAAGISKDFVFYGVWKGGKSLRPDPITGQGIYHIVRKYGAMLGYPKLAPHDLRKTYAQLAYNGGAPIPQIQASLGHAKIETTEKYLGIRQDLQNAPADYIDLDIEIN